MADATRGIENEVPAVWALFDKGIRHIRSALASTYGDSLSINGVFCHGHPWAHFRAASGSATRCETGDLLLAVHHRAGASTLRRSALLLQLKMLTIRRRLHQRQHAARRRAHTPGAGAVSVDAVARQPFRS